MYFKTVIWLVDIRFISLPKVIKKVKSTPKKAFFNEKCRILKTLRCIEKRRNGFEDRTYPNHFQNKNEKQASRLGVEFGVVKKVFPPKTLKQCHMTEICIEKRCNMYHKTVVYNVLKSNFEYLHSR